MSTIEMSYFFPMKYTYKKYYIFNNVCFQYHQLICFVFLHFTGLDKKIFYTERIAMKIRL